ncbi:hypothetical protein LRS11_16895 [Pseudomonas sp. J452]|uniref:hypothetical protein n=1 Tax=Pseudomonas sp. J452 TaxID=2898441 RepID=UPI0021ADCF27|nr:hypothetical protein [Pseudomonas sp. J452]UUY07490.1 hypothetical protein LRS11_16895 [Pseudomonas sp. J452]
MDNARDRITQEIVEAEDLKLLVAVDTYGYQCPGCKTQAFPRAYRQENLVRAHFQLRDPHVSGCEVEGETKVIAQGKRGSVQQELETSPGLSPARLQLVEDRTIVDPALPHTECQTQSVRRLDGATGLVRREGRRAANSIRPICRAFLRFPFDRHLSLAIPGIAPTTYQTAFKKLRAKGLEPCPNARIFYGELAWTPAAESPEHITISLNAGEWEEKKLTPYQVVVLWSEWSAVACGRLKNELEIARQENMKAKKDKQASRSYLFFVGAQDAKNPAIFHVLDHRLICTAHDELVFPVRS